MTDRVWDKVGELQDELARLRDQDFEHVRRLAERAMEAADQSQGAPLVDVVAAAAVKDQVEPLRSQIDAVAAGLTRTQKTFEEQQERLQASLEKQVERMQKTLEEQQEQMEDGIAELSERIRSTEASADSVVKDIALLRASYKDRWDWENDLGGRVDQLARRIESCELESELGVLVDQLSQRVDSCATGEALQKGLQALRTSVDRQVKDNTSAVTELGMRVAQLDESTRKEARQLAESAVTESVNTSKEHFAAEADAIRKDVEDQVEKFREGMETILLATAANKDAVAKVSDSLSTSQTRISDLQDELCQSVAIHTEHRKRLDGIQEAVDAVAKRVDVTDSTQTWVDCCTRTLGQRLDKCEEQYKLVRDAVSDLATQVAVEQTQSINGVEQRCIAAMDARAAAISAEMVDRMGVDLGGVSRKLTDTMDKLTASVDAKLASATERSDAKFATALERADSNLAATADRLDAKLAAASKTFTERAEMDRSRCLDEVRNAARQADALLPRLQAAERQLEACSARSDAAESHRTACEQRQEQRWAAQEQRLMAQEQRLAGEEKRLLAQENQVSLQERNFLAQEQKLAAQERQLAAQERQLAAQERQLAAQERQLANQGQATQQLGDQLAQFPSRVEARIEEARSSLRDDMAASTRCALVSAFQGEMRLEAKMSQLSAASTSASTPVPQLASWDAQLAQLLVPSSPAPQQCRNLAGTPPLPPKPPAGPPGHAAALSQAAARQAAQQPQSPRMQLPQGPAHVAAAALLAGLPGMNVPAAHLGNSSTARFGLGSLVASEAGSMGG